MHRFKDRLAKGQLCRIFCVGRLMHPAVFDIHGMVGGYHGFWIDQEHVGITYEQVVLAASAGRANGMDCFVRMPMTHYSDATANLEAGAGGLMAARIESAAHAEEFIQWVKFAPRGNRGLNASGYDAAYGGKTLPQLSADANRDNFVAIQHREFAVGDTYQHDPAVSISQSGRVSLRGHWNCQASNDQRQDEKLISSGVSPISQRHCGFPFELRRS